MGCRWQPVWTRAGGTVFPSWTEQSARPAPGRALAVGAPTGIPALEPRPSFEPCSLGLLIHPGYHLFVRLCDCFLFSPSSHPLCPVQTIHGWFPALSLCSQAVKQITSGQFYSASPCGPCSLCPEQREAAHCLWPRSFTASAPGSQLYLEPVAQRRGLGGRLRSLDSGPHIMSRMTCLESGYISEPVGHSARQAVLPFISEKGLQVRKAVRGNRW